MTPNQPDDREKSELLPCPFDGSRAQFVSEKIDNFTYFWVECDECPSKTAHCARRDDARRLWNFRRTPASAATTTGETDDPQWDGTDAAHPAWWRGQECGCRETIRVVNEWLDGEGLGGTMRPPFEALKERIVALARAEEERQRLINEIRKIEEFFGIGVWNDSDKRLSALAGYKMNQEREIWRSVSNQISALEAQALALRAQVEELEKERERLQRGLQRADDCIVAFEQATGGLQNVESMRGEFQELREYKIRYEQSRDEIAMMNRLNDSLVSQVASLTAAREQVKAEVVEECARVADTHAQECCNYAAGNSARNYWLDRVEACEWVAARIRALLGEKGDEG